MLHQRPEIAMLLDLVAVTINNMEGLRPHLRLARVSLLPEGVARECLMAEFCEKRPPGSLSKWGGEWLRVYIPIANLREAKHPKLFVETLIRAMQEQGVYVSEEFADEPII